MEVRLLPINKLIMKDTYGCGGGCYPMKEKFIGVGHGHPQISARRRLLASCFIRHRHSMGVVVVITQPPFISRGLFLVPNLNLVEPWSSGQLRCGNQPMIDCRVERCAFWSLDSRASRLFMWGRGRDSNYVLVP